MKNHIIETVIFILALAGIGFYVCKHVLTDPTISHRIAAVDVNGKHFAVNEVHIEPIPQAVYDGIANNGMYKEFLLGNKKQVILFTWDGCPYARAFRQALDKAFTFKVLEKFYKLNVVHVGKVMRASCNSNNLDCPHAWLIQHCGNGICIINPMTKEAIVDESKNAAQILPILMAYSQWNTEPLLESNK